MSKLLLLAMAVGLGLCAEGANAAPFAPQGTPKPSSSVMSVRYHRHYRGGVNAMFRHWCSYNCYAVPPCCGPSFYGHYGYSHYAYDEDIPFPHRFDRDASPVDNADAFIYRYTGEPIIRAFERLY